MMLVKAKMRMGVHLPTGRLIEVELPCVAERCTAPRHAWEFYSWTDAIHFVDWAMAARARGEVIL